MDIDPTVTEKSVYVCRDCGNGFTDPPDPGTCPDCGGALRDTSVPHDD